MEQIELIGMLLFIYCVHCGIINGIIFIFVYYRFGRIKIRLPKNKKYLIKKTPIYELSDDNLLGEYCINKYQLQYSENYKFTIINIFLFPILFNFQSFEYVDVGYHINICDNELKELLENPSPTLLEEIFEKNHTEIQQLDDEYRLDEEEKEKKVNILNTHFNQNYK